MERKQLKKGVYNINMQNSLGQVEEVATRVAGNPKPSNLTRTKAGDLQSGKNAPVDALDKKTNRSVVRSVIGSKA